MRWREDSGSSLPLVLLFFLIAAMLVTGTVSASSAFLAQRDLQSDCDGVAVAAASAVDSAALYARGARTGEPLPLSSAAARTAVETYATRAGLAGTMLDVGTTASGEVTATCRRTVAVPFGALFGYGAGVDRTATSTARSLVNP